MSEKQFYYGIFDDGTEYIEDYWKKKYYFNLDDVEELLNEQQARIEMLEKGILDCLFNNKSVGMLAEEMRLVE